MTKKRFPLGIQTFEDLRTEKSDFVYVDKTEEIYKLTGQKGYYFLSRPRRFGKSLLLSTIDALFSGKQALFEGLWIYDQWDWSSCHPVIRFDLSGAVYDSSEALTQKFEDEFKKNSKRFEIDPSAIDSKSSSGRLADLIHAIYEKCGAKVVLLIDEYDKPIQDTLGKGDLPIQMRDMLRGFYGAIKSNDEYVQFSLMTGITKFGKMGLFSGANNYKDITLSRKYGSIVGFTHNELLTQFGSHFNGADMDKVREWYNGYNFMGESVYNPYDILQFLDEEHRYSNYWWQTGQPTFIVDLLIKGQYDYPNIGKTRISEEQLGAFDVDNIKLEVLLWQAGYLTIHRQINIADEYLYEMCLPNREVSKSMNALFFRVLTNLDD